MSPDPLARFVKWLAAARRARAPLPHAMALATSDRAGWPSVRMVLLATIDRRGPVFYTHAESRKGRDLTARPRAAVVFYWHRTAKQVRIEGRVELVTRAEADRHWKTYPRDTQLATLALDTALEATRRTELVETFTSLRRRWRGKEIPRPARWVGYRILPEVVAFWEERAHRLNELEVFFRARGGWKKRWMPP